MGSGQDTILGTDTVKDALKVKVNDDMTELFATKSEVEAARDGEASLLAKEQAQDAAILAVTGANGSLVSSNDTTPGFLNGKLVAGEGIDLTEGNDGGDETLTVSGEYATSSNKGIASFNPDHFSVVSGVVSMSSKYLLVVQDNVLLNAFRIAINGSLSQFGMVDGVVDEFEDESGVDTGNSVSSYDGTSDYYSPTSYIASQTQSSGGLPLGNYGTNSVRQAQSFKLPTSVTITGASFYLYGIVGSPTGNITLRIETDNAGVPSGTLADANATGSVAPPSAASWIDVTFSSSFTLTAGTTYWLVSDCDVQIENNYWQLGYASTDVYPNGNRAYSSDGGTTWGTSTSYDLAFRVTSTTDTLILISQSVTAEAQPSNCRLVLFEEDVDAITVNTDLKAYISRDGGTTYSQVTLTDEGDYETSKRILAGTVDISGQPAGTSMVWKVENANGKAFYLHGVGMLWG